MPEAKALQHALYARGISAFLCDIPEGQDLAGAVIAALTYCRLAVILGTKTYGKKTESGFSTFEELRYIFEEKKPFFLVKMCNEFAEHETRFRLTSSISYFPWQAATEAERKQLAPGLVDRVVKRLEDVTQGRPTSYVAPPAAAITLQPPAAAMLHGASPAAVGADHDLSRWLQSLQLGEFEPALRKLGAVDAHDVKLGFAEGDITKAMLEAEGLKSLRITRLQNAASKVRRGGLKDRKGGVCVILSWGNHSRSPTLLVSRFRLHNFVRHGARPTSRLACLFGRTTISQQSKSAPPEICHDKCVTQTSISRVHEGAFRLAVRSAMDQ